MAGFFGLFRNKTKYVDEPTDVNDKTQKEDSFYLSDDDAKSLGKSMKKKETKPSVNDSKSSFTKPSSVNRNRSVDSNMDVFRKMAKEIKK